MLGKVMTLLPARLLLDKLAPASPRFRQTFARELTLSEESAKREYLGRVNDLLEPFLAQISRNR